MKVYIYSENCDLAFFTPTREYKYFSSRAEALTVLKSRKQEILDRNANDDEDDFIEATLKVARVEIFTGKQNMLAFLNCNQVFVQNLKPGEITHTPFCLMACEAFRVVSATQPQRRRS